MPRRNRPETRSRNRFCARRGSVLIIILVVILLLTYGVYGFTQRMLAEAEAATAHGKAVQATAFAESGVEFAASVVTARAADPENPLSLYHVPDQFAGIILQQSPTPSSVGRFSLVAPVESDATSRQVRFGLVDESGKLNLNAISGYELEDAEENFLLMNLPGMTEEIADAILDWIDDDSEQRLIGAEIDFYESLNPPYQPADGPLDSIEELLLVRGVTPELLYGEDANRNGLLDPAENDGAASPPFDDGDGVLLPGWSALLTVHSRETNLRVDETQKVDINQGLLKELETVLLEELDEEQVRFILAYRMYGPNDGETDESSDESPDGGSSGDDAGSGDADGESEGRGGGNESGGSSGGSSSSTGRQTGSEAQQLDVLAKGLSNALAGASEGGDVTSQTGLDLSKGAKVEIKSFYDLFDREVDIPADEEKGIEAETLVSPWSSANIAADLPMLLDLFATSEKTAVKGRINVNEARPEVLLGLPNMTPQIVNAIVAARVGPGGQALTEEPERRTTAWLVAGGVVDLPTMRKLDKYLTGRGDVFSVQSVGFFDGGGPAARVEAVIDGTVSPARIVAFRDLTGLGRGYPPAQLLPTAGQTGP